MERRYPSTYGTYSYPSYDKSRDYARTTVGRVSSYNFKCEYCGMEFMKEYVYSDHK